jgi:hypothetical protein
VASTRNAASIARIEPCSALPSRTDEGRREAGNAGVQFIRTDARGRAQLAKCYEACGDKFVKLAAAATESDAGFSDGKQAELLVVGESQWKCLLIGVAEGRLNTLINSEPCNIALRNRLPIPLRFVGGLAPDPTFERRFERLSP